MPMKGGRLQQRDAVNIAQETASRFVGPDHNVKEHKFSPQEAQATLLANVLTYGSF